MAPSDHLPATMLAIAISQPGEPSVLQAEQRTLPMPRDGEVLIRVRAAGVNRPDVAQRKGEYPAPDGASDLPGLEIAGEIVLMGGHDPRWNVGDRVCALVPGGGYAQYCRVPIGHILPLPKGYSFTEAASIPETVFTVWHNVFQRGGLKAGETFLVHGGSSGIGTTAIQLAKAYGATVFATAGSQDKCDACLRLGADVAINYKSDDFVTVIKEKTDGKGVDVILDMVGGDYVEKNYAAAAMDGRIVQIATMNGAKAQANFARLMMKRLTHTGSTLRARSDEFKAALARDVEAKVWPLLEARKIAPVMDMTFPLSEAWRAHERMEESSHIGKIVLDVS